jgi:putative inorganic carbon (HCO3(-)) transporter
MTNDTRNPILRNFSSLRRGRNIMYAYVKHWDDYFFPRPLGGVALGWVGIASAGEQAVQAKAGTEETEDAATGFGAKARRVAEWIAAYELWFLAVPIALLILPHRLAPWGLIVISLLWPIRWLARRHVTVRTPVDVYVLGLLVMIPVALYASVDLARSRIILYQILAGVALFYGLVNALRSERDVWRMAFLLVLGGGGVALIAPLGTTWHMAKLFNLPGIYQRFPRLLPDLIHPNVLAGALVLIIPIGISLLLGPRWSNLSRGGSCTRPGRPQGIAPTTGFEYTRQNLSLRLALGLVLALMLVITALTQSRGAYLALAVGTLLLAVAVNRWFLILGLVAGLGLAAAIQRVGMDTLADLLLTTSALQGRAGRQEVWSRAMFMIQDFPYTGIGLGTFGKVVPVMYPLFLAGPDADVPHAHNLFLQVAVDLGLPGLVAFTALFGGALIAAWKAYRAYGARREAGPRSLALGLLVSLLIMGIHGLTDAVTWGTKPAVIPWCIMGLTMALYRVSEKGGMRGG